MEGFEDEILGALVEGFAARAGMKERLQALTEWEIARRSGYTDASYAEYARHPAREKLTRTLGVLESAGLISVWARGTLYDSFVPTEAGIASAEPSVRSSEEATRHSVPSTQHSPPDLQASNVVERLDEIIRLLKSIDARLAASDRGAKDPRL